MRPFLRAAILAAGLLSAAPAWAAPPTPSEAKMIATVKAEHERNVKLLEALVRVNSGTMNLKGVEEVGRMLRAELEPLGFQVRWIPMAETGRAGHLVATHKGNGRGKRMLLIGHLDTVFEPDSPFQGWTRRGDTVEGPGVGDMKGGNVVIVAALRAMHAAGTLKDADITVVFTGDEEKPGSPIALARRDLIAAGRASDVALDFEGLSREDGRDIGSVARRSSNSWTLKVKAKSGHSSGVCFDTMGCGANYELARIIEAFRKELPEPNLTYNVGMIAGGAKADDTGYPPMAPTEGNKALLRKLNAVNETLGLPEMPQGDPARRGAGDIAFVSFIDGLVGLGLAGDGSHAPGETADLGSLDVQAQRAALLMSRLANEPRGRR